MTDDAQIKKDITQTLESTNRGDTPVIPDVEEPVESQEDKELKAELESLNRYPKLRKWAQLFTDKSNTATYGNRTESAMQAGYNVKDRVSAAQIGAQNFRKLKGLATLFAEDQGVTFNKLMTTISARALTNENPKWTELFMEILGYRDAKGVVVNFNNNTQNNTQINVNAPEVKDFDKEFKNYLKQE